MMKSLFHLSALAALLLLAGCVGAPTSPPCVADWQTACSGPDVNDDGGQ